ncbi:MAG: energy transducer TonB [Saprospiraceae bacterium]
MIIKKIYLLIGLISLVTAWACKPHKPMWTLEKLKGENYQEVKYFYDKKTTTTSEPDKFPMYPGGTLGFLADVKRLTKFSAVDYKDGIGGDVVVQYTISAEGGVENITIVKSLSPGLDAEVVRILKSLKHRWFPAFVNGNPVDVTFLQTFTFEINKPTQEK